MRSDLQFTPCRSRHLHFVKPLPTQIDEYRGLLVGPFPNLVDRSTGLTAWGGWASSDCLGLAGVVELWPGRAEAWAVLAQGAERYMIGIVRRMRYVLDTIPYRRIEMVVRVSNDEGQRLARLLDFNEPRLLLRKYHPDGSDMFMYARVK